MPAKFIRVGRTLVNLRYVKEINYHNGQYTVLVANTVTGDRYSTYRDTKFEANMDPGELAETLDIPKEDILKLDAPVHMKRDMERKKVDEGCCIC